MFSTHESQFQPSDSQLVITKEEDGERPPGLRQGAKCGMLLLIEVVDFYLLSLVSPRAPDSAGLN